MILSLNRAFFLKEIEVVQNGHDHRALVKRNPVITYQQNGYQIYCVYVINYNIQVHDFDFYPLKQGSRCFFLDK